MPNFLEPSWVFFPCGDTCRFAIFFFLHLLRSYDEYFRGFKKYFKCFLLTSPSCSFPQIGVVLVRLVGTDSPFPIPSLYAYWVQSGERVDSGTWLYLSESSVQFFGCPLSKFIMWTVSLSLFGPFYDFILFLFFCFFYSFCERCGKRVNDLSLPIYDLFALL